MRRKSHQGWHLTYKQVFFSKLLWRRSCVERHRSSTCGKTDCPYEFSLLPPMYLHDSTSYSRYSQGGLLKQYVIFLSFGLWSSLPTLLSYLSVCITMCTALFVSFTIMFPNLFDYNCLLNNQYLGYQSMPLLGSQGFYTCILCFSQVGLFIVPQHFSLLALSMVLFLNLRHSFKMMIIS